MTMLVGKIYLTGFHPENNLPMTGEIDCFMGDNVYLCKAHAGGFSAGTPFSVSDMMEWKFFNNQKELQVYLNARQVAINNQLAKQQQRDLQQGPQQDPQQGPQTKKPPRKVGITPKKSGVKRRSAPAKKKDNQALEDFL